MSSAREERGAGSESRKRDYIFFDDPRFTIYTNRAFMRVATAFCFPSYKQTEIVVINCLQVDRLQDYPRNRERFCVRARPREKAH